MTEKCPLGIDESTWKIEKNVLERKEAVEEAKADLKAVCVQSVLLKARFAT